MHVCPSSRMSISTSGILLVEDDRSLRASLRDFLEEHGFETHAAASRAEGQELLRRLRPAVCLLDMNLPDGSGLDLLRLVAAEGLGVRVIVMSAMPLGRLQEQFGPGVLAATLTKPVSPQQLLEAVTRITREG
jgi:two-component system OmpR family response regulator